MYILGLLILFINSSNEVLEYLLFHGPKLQVRFYLRFFFLFSPRNQPLPSFQKSLYRGRFLNLLGKNKTLPTKTYRMAICLFLWINNEDFVNDYDNRTLRSKISHITNFQLVLSLFDTKMAICHFRWIINEDVVNLRSEHLNQTLRPKISHITNFQLVLSLFDTKVTICHFYE